MEALLDATPVRALCHGLPHRDPSIEYRVWVDGQEAYVFNQPGFAGGTVSWVMFDLHRPVRLEIRPHRAIDTARLLPRRAGIQPLVESPHCARLDIPRPGNYLLEWDEGLELPLLIFARPPEETPAPAGGRHIRFGPGRHEAGIIELRSGDCLHLASGAEVYGAIRAVDAHNIRITGRGILRQSHLPFGPPGESPHPVELIRCRNVRIDGPVFVDGCTWNLVFRDCDSVHVRHTSILAERCYSTDGINPCDSREVKIDHCFIRSKDDCISVKGLQRGVPPDQAKPISNITVRDCLFWSDNNNGLVVGTETWASEIRDIHFLRTDLVKVSGTCGDWAAAFAVQALADTLIHRITFEDIDVEHCTGNPFSILFLDEVYGIPGQRRAAGATIRDVTFRNIRFHGKPRRHSIIEGMDPLRQIHGITFDRVSLAGRPVTGPQDLRLRSNSFVHALAWTSAA